MDKLGLNYKIPDPHHRQIEIIVSEVKRKIIRAGRRFGKTFVAAIIALNAFLDGKRVLYAVPTQEQVDAFWTVCKYALAEAIDQGYFYKNETRHIIDLPGTSQRIRAKTAWNADTLRGDFADLLILDEYQLMKADAWGEVGAPMLLDNNGDAIFIFTKKRGKHHSNELFKKAKEDETGRWQTFVYPSHENPYLDEVALNDIAIDMTQQAYRAEILAEDVEDDPDALWKREEMIEAHRKTKHPDLARVVVGVDPPGGATECGIVSAGIDDRGHGYIIGDRSRAGSPNKWGSAVVTSYNMHKADRVVGETNFGGDMVENTIQQVAGEQFISYKPVRASRGKAVRAEPVVALYEKGLIHHVGEFPELEDEMCTWVPGISKWSPNRLDALVWCIYDLMVGKVGRLLMSDDEHMDDDDE